MAIAYQYDSQGYYVGEHEDYGLLPNNATYTAPTERKGYIPHWNGNKWEPVEDHKGESGYVDGKPFTIKDHGPYPEEWSETPPEPTMEEKIEAAMEDFKTRIQARLDGFARTLTYDGILSACTYATSVVEMYRVEGQYCVDARDTTWAKAYALLADILPTVMAGGAIPAWEEIEVQLPTLVWPAGSRGHK